MAHITRLAQWIHTRLTDYPCWHRIRGHHVYRNYIAGDGDGPLTMWDNYCTTCEVAW